MIDLMPAPRAPKDIRIENIFVAAYDRSTKIRLRLYAPKSIATPTPVLIWLHGGGYVMGKPEMDDARCAHLVRELNISIVSVDYRYAPKHPYPTGLEDAYTALKWVESHAPQLGIDQQRIAIGGASAGGGLAAALAQLAYDRQEIKLAFQLLIYPMLDDRTVLRADIDDSHNFTWPKESNRVGWESYLGTHYGSEHVPTYAVPARRADLAGLPPAWIGVGTLDIFHDEDLAYAERLKACGVECEVCLVPGVFHGFDVFDQTLPIIQEFRNSQIKALQKYLCR